MEQGREGDRNCILALRMFFQAKCKIMKRNASLKLGNFQLTEADVGYTFAHQWNVIHCLLRNKVETKLLSTLRLNIKVKTNSRGLHWNMFQHKKILRVFITLRLNGKVFQWKKDKPNLLWKEMLDMKQISSSPRAIKVIWDGMQTRPHPFNHAVLREECNTMVTEITLTLLSGF